jgi:hypothetical protein
MREEFPARKWKRSFNGAGLSEADVKGRSSPRERQPGEPPNANRPWDNHHGSDVALKVEATWGAGFPVIAGPVYQASWRSVNDDF